MKKLGLANKIEDQPINTTCAWESNEIQTNRVRGIIISWISMWRSSQIQTTRDPFEDALQIIYAPAARHAVGHQEVYCTSFQIASHYPSLEDFGGVDGNLVQCSLQAKPRKGVCARARTCAEEMSLCLNIPACQIGQSMHGKSIQNFT